ncbi:hypothetical protein [Pseudomonas sp. H9]|uniref:hypothetical protein n=1 Tax=Pseudomonas sp. H9 TaxID=483968 RepID=UPI001057D7A8|nr:hypothetical protein [Pseudomonas sp. H9]TDF83838.1 hypothetical protein E1573_08755 [Pseudomonas sp. H9]
MSYGVTTMQAPSPSLRNQLRHIVGLLARLCSLPMLGVLFICVIFVHPDWALEQGQFAWLLIILYGGRLLTGRGSISIQGDSLRRIVP